MQQAPTPRSVAADHENPRPLPERHTNPDDNQILESLTRLLFQVGFRWQIVAERWPAFQTAFEGFDLRRVAGYDVDDVSRILATDGMIRNARKVRLAIINAEALLQVIEQHGGAVHWLATLSSETFEESRAVVANRFAGIGPVAAHFFLWEMGLDVPEPGRQRLD